MINHFRKFGCQVLRDCPLGLLLLFLITPQVQAEVSLPSVINSHMVLQREKPLPVWGWAEPGEEVTVTFGQSTVSGQADETGVWRVTLPAVEAGGPFEMTIAGTNTIKLTDILVGEVWVCSGQSNMQWNLARADNAAKEIAAANHPKIRLFNVPRVPAGSPALDVNAEWTACRPETAAGFSAVGYFFGRELQKDLDVPIGLIGTSWGGTKIEPWTPPAGFAEEEELQGILEQVNAQNTAYKSTLRGSVGAYKTWLAAAKEAMSKDRAIPAPPSLPAHPLASNSAPTGLYNGMVHPLVPFAIRGAIWYQGESNRGQGMKYFAMMKALIKGWRTVWGDEDLAFYYVQLAPYRYNGSPTALPEIWEAQTAALSIPNTGMAVTTDIGNINDIHPTNKQDVGKRLALWALAKTYGKQDLVYSGPLYESMAVELDTVRLKFKHADGLKSSDGKQLTWFEIAGEDRKFVPANAEIDGDTVVVESSQVDSPVAVRFGWDQLAEPNLVNGAGLPASPFRTDDWGTGPPKFPTQK